MYTRKLSSLFAAIGSKLRCKNNSLNCLPEAISSSFLSGPSSKNIKNIAPKIFARNFSTEIVSVDKDKIAQKYLDEYIKDPENKKYFEILQLEIDVMRQNAENIPDVMRPRDWYELILLKSRHKRRRYLDYIFGIEKKKESRSEKKRINREEFEQLKAQAAENSSDENSLDYLQYKLGFNHPFLRFYDTTLNRFYNWRLLQASMYGQPIVLDCGYEDEMTRTEVKNCSRQLQLTFAANRIHKEPFHLHYCNFNLHGKLHADFYSYIPTMYEPSFPMYVSDKSYLDHYDKNKIIYLTPDASQEMKEYDHSAVYVIGAIVDKVSGKPMSLAKAKREGLKMLKLPIDTYLNFGAGGGGKSLTLNQMIDILLDIRMTNDWNYALRHVPRRKLAESRQKSLENKINRFLKENKGQAEVYTPPRDFTISARKKFQIKK